MSSNLVDLGFKKILQDGFYALWQREPEKREFLNINIGRLDDDPFLGAGWNTRENGYRWAWKNASVMFKVVSPRKFNLQLTAEAFHENQKTAIYVNRIKITDIIIPTHMEKFVIPINQELKGGINSVHFIFSSAYRPSEVIPESTDRRQFSAKFTNISLSETTL